MSQYAAVSTLRDLLAACFQMVLYRFGWILNLLKRRVYQQDYKYNYWLLYNNFRKHYASSAQEAYFKNNLTIVQFSQLVVCHRCEERDRGEGSANVTSIPN